MTTQTNPPRQIKQRWYYIFWSMATISVVAGQIYVATGYRALAQAVTKALWSIT